jgi:hypothetical protein
METLKFLTVKIKKIYDIVNGTIFFVEMHLDYNNLNNALRALSYEDQSVMEEYWVELGAKIIILSAFQRDCL